MPRAVSGGKFLSPSPKKYRNYGNKIYFITPSAQIHSPSYASGNKIPRSYLRNSARQLSFPRNSPPSPLEQKQSHSLETELEMIRQAQQAWQKGNQSEIHLAEQNLLKRTP
eukprot:maker-scaffold_14-snap-gene-2.52-mRNA-1 protein AED:0.32 eAED:0.32 QI:166/1/1/1/0/0/2/118/110